jgi:hypothetical protein
VFAARYELNSYIVFRKRLVSKRLKAPMYSPSHVLQLRFGKKEPERYLGCSVGLQSAMGELATGFRCFRDRKSRSSGHRVE